MGSTGFFLSFCIFIVTTTAQNVGNPNVLSSYPLCAQYCTIETLPDSGCSSENITCLCSANYHSITAACEKVSCTPTDYTTTQTLAAQLCAPIYSNDTVNPSSVSAAIASSTAAAAAAVAGKDVTSIASFPSCAQACQSQFLSRSGCGSLANRACVCPQATNETLGGCEVQHCSQDDLTTINYLAYALCNPVGGFGNTSTVANQTVATQTAPAPAAFTSGAQVLVAKGVAAGLLAILIVLGLLALWMS